MKQPSFKRTAGQAQARVSIVLLILVFLGLAAGAFWFYRHDPARIFGGVALSDNTKTVLQDLNSPVEIRFYSLLDPASVPPPRSPLPTGSTGC